MSEFNCQNCGFGTPEVNGYLQSYQDWHNVRYQVRCIKCQYLWEVRLCNVKSHCPRCGNDNNQKVI